MITSYVDLLNLEGKVAVVTGGGRGIGRAIAERFGDAGARVVIADRDPAAETTAKELREAGYRAEFRQLDVTDSEQHESLADEVVETFGRLDIWVNNAGIFPTDYALEMTDSAWRKVFAVNTDGAFFGSRAAGRRMRESGGVIVNLASASAFRVTADARVHYAASKAAVVSITQGLARELGPYGIRVLAIAPTATATEGLLGDQDALSSAKGGDTSYLDTYAQTLPLRRYAQPDDIARVVLFAASDLAGLVTGATIPVDAGQLAV